VERIPAWKPVYSTYRKFRAFSQSLNFIIHNYPITERYLTYINETASLSKAINSLYVADINDTASLNKARNTVKESVYSINLLLLLLLPPPPPRPLLEAGNFLTSLVTTTFSRRLPLQGVRLLGWRI